MCREAFYPGKDVVLSLDGWAQGLSVNYAYTIGKVVDHKNGILTVRRENIDLPQEFLCRFWELCGKKVAAELRTEEYKDYWLDHHADPIDDFQFSNE